jgi:hypothetical protein
MNVMSSRNTRQVRYQASNTRAKLNRRQTPAAALRDTELDPRCCFLHRRSKVRIQLEGASTPVVATAGNAQPPSHNAYAWEIQRLVRGTERSRPSCGMSKGHKSWAAKETLWAAVRQTNLKRVGCLDTGTNQSQLIFEAKESRTGTTTYKYKILEYAIDTAARWTEMPEKRTSRRCNRPDIKCGDGSQWTENKPLIEELVDVDPDNGRNGRTG